MSCHFQFNLSYHPKEKKDSRPSFCEKCALVGKGRGKARREWKSEKAGQEARDHKEKTESIYRTGHKRVFAASLKATIMPAMA